MLRRILCAAVLLGCAGFALAAEYKGTLTALDTEGKTLKIKVGDDEKTLKLGESVEYLKGKKGGKAVADEELKKMTKHLSKTAREATVTTTGEGDKEVVSKVVFAKAAKKKQ